MDRPADLDTSRAAVADRGLVAVASSHLTETVAVSLTFESLGGYKTLLKTFFSHSAWTSRDESALADLVDPVVAPDASWTFALDGELTMWHGRHAGSEYRLYVTGAAIHAPSVFDRVFGGPVTPEPTPHPAKVKFTFGGAPSPGVWYRRDDAVDDHRAAVLLEQPDVTDVMVAGSFVTIGLRSKSDWEGRLDDFIDLVTGLFPIDSAPPVTLTREELMRESGRLQPHGAALHLLDPDDETGRETLQTALERGTVLERRIAVAILSDSSEPEVSRRAIDVGSTDASVSVRRTAIDAAADLEDPALRRVFEEALEAEDPWTRWRAARALGTIGAGESRAMLEDRRDDPDFQVRFEVARVLGRD